MQRQKDFTPPWIDWDKLSYIVDLSNQTVFTEMMTRILADEEGYQERWRNVLLNKDLFDFEAGGVFDTYMYFLQAEIYPTTRKNQTRFTALKLDVEMAQMAAMASIDPSITNIENNTKQNQERLELQKESISANTSTGIRIVGKNEQDTVLGVEQETSGTEKKQRTDWLLSVPFYIYEELLMDDAIFRNGTTDLVLLDDAYAMTTNNTANVSLVDFMMHQASGTFKREHFNDYYFVKSALSHPMRTKDQEQAKLFLIPILGTQLQWMDNYLEGEGFSLCWKGICGAKQIFSYVNDYLGNSKWFQQMDGRNHIFVNGMWGRPLSAGKKNLKRCNVIHWSQPTGMKSTPNDPDRLLFPVQYVARGCQPTNHKLYDASLFANMPSKATYKGMGVRFNPRKNLCKWMKNDALLMQSTNYTAGHCGGGKNQCPGLAASRFGFHVRGDTIGASRLFHTILSGTVCHFSC